MINLITIFEAADLLDIDPASVRELIRSGKLKQRNLKRSSNRKYHGINDDDMLMFLLQNPKYIENARYYGTNPCFRRKLEDAIILAEIYSALDLIEKNFEYIRILINLLDK